MYIDISGDIVEAIFIKRLNRFVAEILVDEKIHLTHVPNTGRMKELLVNNARVIVRRVNNPKRKTKYDLLMVYFGKTLVCIDSKLPNSLLYKALKARDIENYNGYKDIKREVTYGNSRIDIGLIGNNKNTLIEAKCVTYVEDGVAKFPDAPTDRGTRHVKELIKAKKEGFECGVVFIIQRNDAKVFKPHFKMDKDFSEALILAKGEGVNVNAYICDVKPYRISISKEIEVQC